MASSQLEQNMIAQLEAGGHSPRHRASFDWLTNRVPSDAAPSLPPRVKYRLVALHVKLGGSWKALEAKRRQPLRVGIQVDDSTLIEIDETPHFSSARLVSLDFYDGLDHALDLSEYQELCIGHQDEADRYQRTRQAPDFPFPGGRAAQRAYFDTAKDLVAAAFGLRLLRLPAPNGELTPTARLALRLLG